MEDLSDILKRVATRTTSGDSSGPFGPDGVEDGEEPCPRCGGRGWLTNDVPVGDPDFGAIVTCDCQQERLDEERHARLIRYSNLGYLTRFTFDTFTPKGLPDSPWAGDRYSAAYRAASEFAEQPSGWLVLAGPSGSGKTHLAAAVGNRSIDRGRLVFFSHVPDLLDHLRAAFSPAAEMGYSELFDQVKSTPLLILDGLGSHSTTSWADEKLLQIINHRYNAQLPTVITVAGDLDALDPYILSRLRSPGFSQVAEFISTGPERALSMGGIEPRLLDVMTFDTFDVRGNNPTDKERASLEAAFEAATSFTSDPDGWLTISGETGVGKTHLAVAIARERLKNGQPVFFAFVPDLMDYLREAFNPESAVTYDRLFDQVKNTELLILDDLGKERSSAWAIEKLYQIVVHRHNARLPTVITSMLGFTDELDPITSRVQDPSVSLLLKIDAPDYRNKSLRPRGQRRTGARRQPGSR